MTRRRWIADGSSADQAWLTGDHARHLVDVLRARVGEEFDIVSDGRVRLGKITALTTGRVEFELAGEVQATDMAAVRLVLAVYKFDRMEWAIEKCAELGVDFIVPVISARTDVHLAKSAEKRCERWQRLVRQAAEQSRRSSIPQVSAPVALKETLGGRGLRIVLAETEEETDLAHWIQRDYSAADAEPVTLAIGPEGGWTEQELAQFEEAGWRSATLGPTILRAETAALAAVAITFSSLQR